MSEKERLLDHDRVRSLFHYDAQAGRLIWARKISPFSNVPVGAVAGTLVPRCGYRAIRIDKKGFYEHRLIWFWHHGEWPYPEIDHINGERTDNRIENLRVVTREQNQANIGTPSNNKSGIRGVFFLKRLGKWRASIGFDRKRVILGHFNSRELAAAAYSAARAKHHGRFIRAEQTNEQRV
jgi:hypothetical protein